MSDELHRFPPLVATHADHLRAQLAAEGERADKAEAKADRLLRDVTREASRRVLAETERDNQRDRADKAETERDEHRRRVEQAEALLFEASWALDEGSDLQERLDAYCIEHGLGWRP